MKKELLAGYLIGLFLIGLAGTVNATVMDPIIYDNGMSYAGYGTSHTDIYFLADDFQFQKPHLVTDVHWIGSYGGLIFPLPEDNFTINIYEDDGSGTLPTSPGSALYTYSGAVTREDNGNQILGYPAYEYSAFIAPFYAEANEKYWLEIYNNTAWAWGEELGVGNAAGHWFYETDWSVDNALPNMSFQLTGAPIPEPATMLLLGTGLVGVAGAARRKKKNQA